MNWIYSAWTTYNTTPQTNKVKTKRIHINNTLKSLVWTDTYGEIYNTKCYVCELNTITPFKHHVGHIISLANGGDNKRHNLKPICEQCNLTMGTKNMNEFKESIN